MTARKPAKPKPRKAAGLTLAQRMDSVESALGSYSLRLAAQLAAARVEADRWREVCQRLDALETRSRYRDASHDEPVSNAGEAIGQHFRIVGELPRVSRWRRFWNFMGSAS